MQNLGTERETPDEDQNMFNKCHCPLFILEYAEQARSELIFKYKPRKFHLWDSSERDKANDF